GTAVVINGRPPAFYSHIECATAHAAVWTDRHPAVCPGTECDLASLIHAVAQSKVSAAIADPHRCAIRRPSLKSALKLKAPWQGRTPRNSAPRRSSMRTDGVVE